MSAQPEALDTGTQFSAKRSRGQMARLYWNRLRRQPVAMVGTLIFLFFFVLALIGPYIAPYDFDQQDVPNRLQGPSLNHPFGTDNFGRDVFSRVIAGSRGIFLLGGTGTFLALLAGTAVGLFSGFYGGLWDEVLMRILDVLLSIPPLLLALILLATVGPSLLNLILVVAVLYIPMIARVVRSMVLDLKTKEFVEAAKVRGEKDGYILSKEILPNALPPLLVEGSMRFSYSIFLVASLGFLGLGVQPPSPDWGLQINEGRNFLQSAPWMILFPAVTISVLVVATNLMSDGLRRVFQPGREEV